MKDGAGARGGIALVPEQGFSSGALIREGQGKLDAGNALWQRRDVDAGLLGHAGEGHSFGLGFDDAGRPAVHEEKIVGLLTAEERELAHGDAEAGGAVQVAQVLDGPARGVEHSVYVLTRSFFGRHGALRGPTTAALM